MTPNSPNVIPGLAHLSIELRDLSPQTLAAMMDDIRARAREIAATTRTTIAFTHASTSGAGDGDAGGADARSSAPRRRCGSAASRLPSGAGHDAQMMAQLGPMGMIFVPSVGGISHSPKELTRWDDCAHGADVLLRASSRWTS